MLPKHAKDQHISMFSRYLDEWCSAEEKPKHVGHDVVADHTGNGNNEPIQRERERIKGRYFTSESDCSDTQRVKKGFGSQQLCMLSLLKR